MSIAEKLQFIVRSIKKVVKNINICNHIQNEERKLLVVIKNQLLETRNLSIFA